MDYFGDSRIKVAESVGALNAMLFQLQQKERSQVLENFGGFDNPEIHATFLKVFNTEERIDENNRLLQ